MSGVRTLLKSCQLLAVAAIAIIGGAASASAQSAATASLAGTVFDSSKATVADAAVSIAEMTTGVTRTVQTRADGTFLLPLLPPGRYALRVEKSGFNALRSEGIVLEVGDDRRVELQLQVGNLQDAVSVTAAPSEASRTDVSLVVNEQRVRDLPLNGKNFLKLALLTPGVGVGSSNPVFTGARSTTNTFLIDGLGSSDQRGNRGIAVSGGAALFSDASPNLISTEAIQEFRVITSNADATFGRGSGGQVSIVTKSGTNDRRGSAYYYLRNDALDARDFFNTGPFLDDQGRAKVPPFKQHQYGGTLGGPIRRDRHFFFGSFEGFRQRLKQSDATTIIPNAALISLMPGDLGRFYRTFYVDRDIVPATGNPPGEFRPAYTTEAERQQFLAAGLDPALFDGNVANGEAGGVRLSSARTRDVDQDSLLIRSDHQMTDRLALSARYGYSRSQQLTNLIAIPSNNTSVPLRWHQGLGQANYVVTPSQYLEVRAGLLRSDYGEGNAAGVDARLHAIGVSDLGVAIIPSGTLFSQLTASPRTTFSDYQTVPEASVLHSWARGPLTLRSGMQWRKSYLDTFSAGSATPVYTFNGYLGPNGIFGERAGQSQAVASALNVTVFGTGGGSTTPLRHYRQAEQEYFSQADIRASRDLTLNLGVRYSYFAPLSERDNLLSNLYAVNSSGQLVPDAAPFAFGRLSNRVERVSDDLPFYQPDRNNFQPRAGAVWDVAGRGRTIVRTAYGLYTDRLIQLMVLSAPNSTPFSISGSAASTPFSLGGLPAFGSTTLPGIFGIDPTLRNPQTHRYNVTVEQRLDRATTVSLSYVGAAGRGLTWNANYNGGSGGVPQALRPDQRFALMTLTSGEASSDYDAFQMLLHRRWTRGLDFTVAYTYAKSRDNVTQDSFGSPPALINTGGSSASGFQGGGADSWILRPLSANQGYSDFDLRHNLTISHVWELPIGKGRRFFADAPGWVNAIISGYSLSGLAIFRSGQPVDLTYSGDLADVGAFSVRPVLVSGSLDDLYAGSGGTRTQYLIPAADARQRLVTQNVTDPSSWIQRNALRGPGVQTYDVSLVRRVAIGSHRTLSIEVNAFNVLNHTNFGNPTGNLGSAFFGQVSSIAAGTTPRQIQLGLRMAF